MMDHPQPYPPPPVYPPVQYPTPPGYAAYPNPMTMDQPPPETSYAAAYPNPMTMDQPPPPLGYGVPPNPMMMGQPPPPPGYAPAGAPNPIAVLGHHFCSPYAADLTIVEKVMTLKEGDFSVCDVNGNVVFKVQGSLFSIRDRRVLQDSAGNPVVSMQQKILTAHRRWQAFRGDSADPKDLVFSVKKSSLLQFKTELDVFLAGNTTESEYDFKIKGSWRDKSCVVYQGNSSNIIAQMHKKHSVQSVVLGRDTFAVTVYPHVDYAFVVALIVILNEINLDRRGKD